MIKAVYEICGKQNLLCDFDQQRPVSNMRSPRLAERSRHQEEEADDDVIEDNEEDDDDGDVAVADEETDEDEPQIEIEDDNSTGLGVAVERHRSSVIPPRPSNSQRVRTAVARGTSAVMSARSGGGQGPQQAGRPITSGRASGG